MREIVVKGLVTIKQGDKIVARAQNHFVERGLKGLLSTIIFSHLRVTYMSYGFSVVFWHSGWTMRVGQDVSTQTFVNMSDLASKIDVAPDSQQAVVKDGSADGVWAVTFVATWNAGTIGGTCGELALYMKAPQQTDFQWYRQDHSYDPGLGMVSRLASADGDFSSFIIDETKPLTVEWTIQFAFA